MKPYSTFFVSCFLIINLGCGRESELPVQTIANATNEVHVADEFSASDPKEKPVENGEPVGQNEPVGNSEPSDDDVPSEGQDFVEQEIQQLSSPFTKQRVIQLNSIVAKSLKLINEFDECRKAIDQIDQRSMAEFKNQLEQLSVQATTVRQEMDEARKDLENSGEAYNRPIFAAMQRFVIDVDEEIQAEIRRITNQLNDQ